MQISDHRIKFYSASDMSCGYWLTMIEEKLQSPIHEIHDGINEAIEFYNIKKYIEGRIFLPTWTNDQIQRFKEQVSELSRIIALYFKGISSENMSSMVEQLDNNYVDVFWQLIDLYEIYNNISKEAFYATLKASPVHLRNVLQNKKLSNYFGKEIMDYMLTVPETTELLLSFYLEADCDASKKLYFPHCLTNEMKSRMLECYINSDTANPNYLELIARSQSSKELPLPDSLRLAAKRKHGTYVEEHFANSTGLIYGVAVSFREDQEEYQIVHDNTDSDTQICISYGTKWISDNLDYPTLMNNFIYLFEFVDRKCRSHFPSIVTQMSILESSLGVKGKREYTYGIGFQMSNMLFSAQMRGYCRQIEINGISIENIFHWFFHEYLPSEFNATGFVFNAPTTSATTLEKIKLLASELDSVLKQFQLYVANGSIDRELFEMSSGQIVFDTIPSLIRNKYYYSAGNCQQIMYLLFSDQTLLGYIDRIGDKYDTLYDLLCKEAIFMVDYKEFQITSITWLAERGFLVLDENGQITLEREKVNILWDLYQHEVGCRCYWHSLASTVDALVSAGYLKYNTSLFSLPEQAYLNFVLNKKEFSNGLDLRNKYLHGTYPLDEKTQSQDYCELLKIMVMVIIKINEEFCLYDEILKKKKKQANTAGE